MLCREKKLNLLSDTRKWFEQIIIPKRTARAGFSGNRLWKSPRALIFGNSDDPDGICGDAASFVVENFYNEYGDYNTSDGFTIGLVVRKGDILNHMANVMLQKGKVGPETYKWDNTMRRAISMAPTPSSYVSSDLLRLSVYDLYYKKISTIEAWWRNLDSKMNGSIKIGQLYSIED